MKNLMIILLLFIINSCNDNNYRSFPLIDYKDVQISKRESSAPSSKTNYTNASLAKINVFNTAKKFTKEANINYKSDNIDSALNQTKKLVSDFDGYIVKEDKQIRNDFNEIYLQFKIPTSSFEAFIDSLNNIVGDFESKSINIKDVTEEYIDTQTRLENKKKLESKYRDLLGKANTVKDLLEIEQYLERVRIEIESAEKRMLILQNDIDFSTIFVRFYNYNPSTFNHYNINFFRDIWRSVERGWYNMIRTIINLFASWPLIILLIVIYIFVKKYIKKRKLKNTV